MGVFDRAPKSGNPAIERMRKIRAKQCHHIHVSLKGTTSGPHEHYCPVCGKNYRCGKGE